MKYISGIWLLYTKISHDSYSCLELRLDRIWWYSPGCMVGVLMSIGVMTVGVMTVGVMTVGVMRRPRFIKCAELVTRTNLIWMRFGTSDHIFNIHDVQLIIIFISLTKIKDIVENLYELPVLLGFVYKRPRLDLALCCCCYFPLLLYWLRTGHL
jgi:hypothetical protein